MKVKMLTIYASAVLTAPAGSVIDVPEAEARALVDGGYAVAEDALPKVKTARGGGRKAAGGHAPANTGTVLDAGAGTDAENGAELTAEQVAAQADAADLLAQAADEDDLEVKARIEEEAAKILEAAGLPAPAAGAQ